MSNTQQTGCPPLAPAANCAEAGGTAEKVSTFIRKAGEMLREEPQANILLLRGFAAKPEWPSFKKRFGLRAAAAAGYPKEMLAGRRAAL